MIKVQNTPMNSYLRFKMSHFHEAVNFKWTYHRESVGLVAKQ